MEASLRISFEGAFCAVLTESLLSGMTPSWVTLPSGGGRTWCRCRGSPSAENIFRHQVYRVMCPKVLPAWSESSANLVRLRWSPGGALFPDIDASRARRGLETAYIQPLFPSHVMGIQVTCRIRARRGFTDSLSVWERRIRRIQCPLRAGSHAAEEGQGVDTGEGTAGERQAPQGQQHG